MLSSGELVAWWNLSHSLGGHCCTLLGALHGVRCSSQVCMYVRQSSCTLLACLHSPQLLRLAAAAASLLFVLCFVCVCVCVFFFKNFFCKIFIFVCLFVFGFESEAQVSQFVSHGDDHPSESKKKIPGKKKNCLAGLRECKLQDPSTMLSRLLCSAVEWKLMGFVRLDSWICGSFEFCTNLVCSVS
jgi:hypothetical protein